MTLQPNINAKLYALKVYLEHLFKEQPELKTGEEVIEAVVKDMRALNNMDELDQLLLTDQEDTLDILELREAVETYEQDAFQNVE